MTSLFGNGRYDDSVFRALADRPESWAYELLRRLKHWKGLQLTPNALKYRFRRLREDSPVLSEHLKFIIRRVKREHQGVKRRPSEVPPSPPNYLSPVIHKTLRDWKNQSGIQPLNRKSPGVTGRQSDVPLTTPTSPSPVADETLDGFNSTLPPSPPNATSLAAHEALCNSEESNSALPPTLLHSPTIAAGKTLCNLEVKSSLGFEPPRATRERSKIDRVATPPQRRLASDFPRFGDLPQELIDIVLEFCIRNSEAPTVTIGAAIVQSTTSDGTIARTSLSVPRLPPIFHVSHAARGAAMAVARLMKRLHPVYSPWLDLAGNLYYHPPTQVLEINLDTTVMETTPLVVGEIFYWLRALPMMKKIQRLHIRSANSMLPHWQISKNIAEELDFEFPSLAELSFSRHPYDEIRKEGWQRPTWLCPSIDHLLPAFDQCGPESRRLYIFLSEWLLTQTATFYRNSWRGRAGLVTTWQPGHTFPISSLVHTIGREARLVSDDSFVLYPRKDRVLVVPAGEEVLLDRLRREDNIRSMKFKVVDAESACEENDVRREHGRRLICQ